jgi:hypothetical protein
MLDEEMVLSPDTGGRDDAVKEEEGDSDRRDTTEGDIDRCNMRFIINCCALQLFTQENQRFFAIVTVFLTEENRKVELNIFQFNRSPWIWRASFRVYENPFPF